MKKTLIIATLVMAMCGGSAMAQVSEDEAPLFDYTRGVDNEAEAIEESEYNASLVVKNDTQNLMRIESIKTPEGVKVIQELKAVAAGEMGFLDVTIAMTGAENRKIYLHVKYVDKKNQVIKKDTIILEVD